MDNKKYQRLNMENFNAKKSIFVSSQESLKDIVPINWSIDVLKGKRKITVNKSKWEIEGFGMCKIGDIILVNKYIDNGKTLNRHSFIVLNDESGKIQGLDYNIICNVMSSFKSEEHKQKKLKYYPKNFPVSYDDVDILAGGNCQDGYVKLDQFYYFNKENLDYIVIGSIDTAVFNEIIRIVQELDNIQKITDNLTKKEPAMA